MAFVAVRRPATEGTMGVPRAQGERQVGVWPVLSSAARPDSGGAAVPSCLLGCVTLARSSV